MAKLLSSCYYAGQRIPEKYVVPPEKRPGNYVKANVPVVDLHDHGNNITIHQLMKASQDFGFFQVVNHGVPSDLLDEAMQIFKEVFNLPHEEKLKINKEDDTNGMCKIFTNRRDNNNETGEKAHFWRDALTHYINNPLEQCIKFWPQNPEKYREIVKAYVIAMESLGARILELVAQGLGLEQGYFGGKLGGECNCCLQVNHYPPCPEPDLTLGLEQHADVSLITILLQGTVPGLQLLLKDGQWMGVETLPHALLVFIGNQLEVVSNGKLRSGIHRAVTNASKARTSAAFFIAPSMDCIVEPAKTLVDNGRPLYKPFLYKDIYDRRSLNLNSKEEYEDVLDVFKIKA